MAQRKGTLEGLGMTPDFWRGRRVFLTGHTGFKGAWLSLLLRELGASVSGYALAPPPGPNLFDLAKIDGMLHHQVADIRDGAALTASVRAAQPDIVIHMAAQALVRESYVDPVATYATNVMGTVNLLEAVRAVQSVRAVLVVTTDKCYANSGQQRNFQEEDRLGGYDPYSNSKACCELVVSSYRDSFFNGDSYAAHGVALASARAGNVIGGGDWSKDRLIPDLMGHFMQGTRPCLRSPHATRPWQHVLECLRGYLILCERLFHDGVPFAQAWNFGPKPGDAKPVAWIADTLAALWGPGAGWDVDERPQPHEAAFLQLDTSKAAERLDYHPVWGLDHALPMIAAWFRAYQSGADAATLTQGQIAAFRHSVAAAQNGKSS